MSSAVYPDLKHGKYSAGISNLATPVKFAAGVRDLGRKRDLCRNHLSLFSAIANNLGRKWGLGAKISQVTEIPKNAQNFYH